MTVVYGFTGCCGASIFAGFGEPTPAVVTQFKQRLVVLNHQFTAILTDEQMMVWAKVLKDSGFRRVSRWYNGNSGNFCNLLVCGKNDETGVPYEWD